MHVPYTSAVLTRLTIVFALYLVEYWGREQRGI